MRRGLRVLVAAATAGVALGCANVFDGVMDAKEAIAPSENRRACEAWVNHVNALEACMKVTYEADNYCDGLDRVPVDMRPWFTCLTAHTSCEGDDSHADFDACPAPVRVADAEVRG